MKNSRSSHFLFVFAAGFATAWYVGGRSPLPVGEVRAQNSPTTVEAQFAQMSADFDRILSRGKNLGVVGNTNAAVFSDRSGKWITARLSGGFQIIESDGNFCALGNGSAAVFSDKTQKWSYQNLGGARQMISSQGSFCVLGSGSAAVWDVQAQSWDQENLRAGTNLSVSQGNFCAVGENKAVVWSKKKRTWIAQPVPGARQTAGSGG
ncbi:MAG: hypothetical protein QM496_17625 [Verrucomicrobiota bacterium]